MNADIVRSVAGAVLWGGVATQVDLADAFLILAPLVIVPLGLRLLCSATTQHSDCAIFHTARILQFPAAVLFAVGWLATSDVVQHWCAIPWMLATCLFAASAVRIICRRRQMSIADFTLCAAMMFIAVGGGWALFYRLQYQPFGFPLAIVKLTAIHLHYAGFALPIILAETTENERPDLALSIALCVTLGIPIVAIGITLSPVVELLGALILALGCLRLSLVVIHCGMVADAIVAKLLLLVSGVSLFVSMILAIVYAVGEFRGEQWVGISAMVRSHGVLNAIGFATCGLIALNMQLRKSKSAP